MWVEIIGLPGVGKTTLIKSNFSAIRENYKIIESRRPSLINRFAAKVLYFLFYKKKINDNNLALKLAYRHSFRLDRDRSENLFFYDSGIIQVIIENLIETNFEDYEKKIGLLAIMPVADTVIYIKDELRETVKREVNRPDTRFGLDLEETSSRYKIAQQLIEKVILQIMPIIDTISPHNPTEFKKALNRDKTS